MTATPNSQLGYFLNRMQPAGKAIGRLPNTDDAAGLKREDRGTASTIAKRIREQFDEGLSARTIHGARWTQVVSILSGVHWFHIDAMGRYQPLTRNDDREVMAAVPVMEPAYRRELGRVGSNKLGVQATPVSGKGDEAFYKAQIAQEVINHWVREIDLETLDDEMNQLLLVYGGYAMMREKSPERNQVFLRYFPFCDLFPIPSNATTWQNMDGVMRAVTMPQSWLEMQDDLYERRNGQKPTRPMTTLAHSQSGSMHARFTAFGQGLNYNVPYDGALAIWVWMKPTDLNPHGEHMFLIENEMFGYVSGTDQQGQAIALDDGELPLQPVYYTKKPHDWWPYGFCEQITSMQLEINRQMSEMIEGAQQNRGFTFYNSSMVTADDIQNTTDGMVPFRFGDPQDKTGPVLSVPPHQINRERVSVLQSCYELARQAAGHDSDIIFGQQEGRTEGGPATSLLNMNAQAPLQPVLDRKWRAYRRLFRGALADIREVWPKEKRIKAIGTDGIARERVLARDKLPGHNDVDLSPLPLVVNGRAAMLNMVMGLRQQLNDDGKTPMVSASELRQAMYDLNLNPPGLVMFDETEQRIRWRIDQLINDGVQPAIAPADQDRSGRQQIEDHRTAADMLRSAILDPPFVAYSQAVQRALIQEFQYHQYFVGNFSPTVSRFDDADAEFEQNQTEQRLWAAEADPETADGLAQSWVA